MLSPMGFTKPQEEGGTLKLELMMLPFAEPKNRKKERKKERRKTEGTKKQ